MGNILRLKRDQYGQRVRADGFEKNFSYDEVLRAIRQQPLDVPVPKRVGLKTYEDIFFSNLINDQSSYLGDVKKTGFSHEAPYEPPPRPEVYFDARSDAGDGVLTEPPYTPHSRGGGPPPPPPPPPGNLCVCSKACLAAELATCQSKQVTMLLCLASIQL